MTGQTYWEALPTLQPQEVAEDGKVYKPVKDSASYKELKKTFYKEAPDQLPPDEIARLQQAVRASDFIGDSDDRQRKVF